MSLLLRLITPTPPAALSEPLSFYPADPARRRPPVSLFGGVAALVLAPLLAPPLASFPDWALRRTAASAQSAPAAFVQAPALAPPAAVFAERTTRKTSAESSGVAGLHFDAARDAPPPVQSQERARARSESRAQPHLPDRALDAPPPVLAQERARARSESRTQPLLPEPIAAAPLPVLVDTAGENEHHRQRQYDQAREVAPPSPDAIRDAPPPVQGQERARSHSESRAQPHLPDRVRDGPPPVLSQERARSRSESRAQPLLPAEIVPAPLPVLVDTAGENEHHRQRAYDQATETAFLLDQLQGLPPSAEWNQAEQPTDVPAGSIADVPAIAIPPKPDIFRGSGGAWKKKRQWIDLEATARDGRVTLTIEELLEPEPAPEVKQVELDPRIVEILADTPGLEIHDTPELRSLRAEVIAIRAAKADLATELEAAELSARRWKLGALALAAVLLYYGVKRR